MAEVPAIPAFSGDSWDQYSTLIHNVLNAAWKEGKIEDQTWMANFASIHFLGEALVWYACLPRDVQKDWSKLQVALANRWSAQKGEFPAFSGDSWDQCSTLIHNVRHAAWREGKIRDKAWMADLASIHFEGEALAWYTRLPEDIQEDWSKLQAALSNRWSTPDAAASEDTAAPEDATATDGKSCYFSRGLLKAVVNGSGTTLYVQEKPNNTLLHLLDNVERAAHFRFRSLSSSTLPELINSTLYEWVAIHWGQDKPTVGPGSTDWGYVSKVNPETMKPSWDSSTPFQLLRFKFLSSGEVVPVRWDGKTERDLTVFAQGTYIKLVPDPEAYGKEYTGHKRVTLYIQKIEE